MHAGTAWARLDNLLEFNACLGFPPCAQKGKSEIIMGIGAVRPDLQGLPGVKNRFFKAILLQGEVAKTIMGRVVLWIDVEGMGPEGATITPVSCLLPSGPHQDDN